MKVLQMADYLAAQSVHYLVVQLAVWLAHKLADQMVGLTVAQKGFQTVDHLAVLTVHH